MIFYNFLFMDKYVERFLDAIRADVDLVWEKRGGDNPWPKLEARYRKIVRLMADNCKLSADDFYLPISEDLVTESLYFWNYNDEIKTTIVYDFVSSMYGDFERGYFEYARRKKVMGLMLLRFNGLGGVLRHVYSFIPANPIYLA